MSEKDILRELFPEAKFSFVEYKWTIRHDKMPEYGPICWYHTKEEADKSGYSPVYCTIQEEWVDTEEVHYGTVE